MSEAPAEIAEMGYEQARDALVDVVRRLETGGATLEESLALWERGEALAARCEEWLAGARARVEAAQKPQEQSAALWWPADRAWCVATDVDLVSSYVAGSAACIAEVLATPGLEAVPAAPGDAITYDADTVNPQPTRG